MTAATMTAADLLILTAERLGREDAEKTWARGSKNQRSNKTTKSCECLLEAMLAVHNERTGDPTRDWTAAAYFQPEHVVSQAINDLGACIPDRWDGFFYEHGTRVHHSVSESYNNPFDKVWRWNDTQIDKRKVIRLLKRAAKRSIRRANAA